MEFWHSFACTLTLFCAHAFVRAHITAASAQRVVLMNLCVRNIIYDSFLLLGRFILLLLLLPCRWIIAFVASFSTAMPIYIQFAPHAPFRQLPRNSSFGCLSGVSSRFSEIHRPPPSSATAAAQISRVHIIKSMAPSNIKYIKSNFTHFFLLGLRWYTVRHWRNAPNTGRWRERERGIERENSYSGPIPIYSNNSVSHISINVLEQTFTFTYSRPSKGGCSCRGYSHQRLGTCARVCVCRRCAMEMYEGSLIELY